MKKKITASAIVGMLTITLTACGGATALDTAEGRVQAVQSTLAEVESALSEYDSEAIKKLQCVEPYATELPSKESLEPGVQLPLAVEAIDAEPLDLSDSTYSDPDPAAEFYLASMQQRGDALDAPFVMLPDVVIRVDDELACLWAMGPPFALLMGL